MSAVMAEVLAVLNLVISGIPSIHNVVADSAFNAFSFKPCYKWNTFNTEVMVYGVVPELIGF